MKMNTFSVSCLIIFIIVAAAHAQSQYLRAASNQSISIEINERAFAGLSLSYSKGFQNAFAGQGLYIQGGIEIPVMLIASAREFNDFDLFVESGTCFFQDKRVGIGAAGRLFLDRQTDILGTRTAWGFQLMALPCLQFNKFVVGVDFAWHQVIGMYIQHSTCTKETFQDLYPAKSGPKDGCYLAPATVFKTGLACGGILRKKITMDFPTVKAG